MARRVPIGDPWGTLRSKNVRMPAFFMQIRLEKEGFETVEFATHGVVLLGQNIPLPRAGGVPAGMLAAPERPSWLGPIDVMPLPGYFLDKFEVTNRQFKEFVEAGGYRDSRYWKHPFRRRGWRTELGGGRRPVSATQLAVLVPPVGHRVHSQKIKQTFPSQV